MKNNRLIDSWNKIEPDSAADARMLDAILTRNKSMGQSNKGKVLTMKKTFAWKRLAPVAACLIMVVAITAIFGNNAGWFDNKTYAVELDGGTLNFYKSDFLGTSSLDFGADTVGRNLTSEENDLLFTNLSVASYGIFNASDNELLHVEGRTGNTKIILAAHSTPVTDTVIETNRNTSEINDVKVSAGYFITRANSQGGKSIVYIASFDMNGVQFYLESSGNEDMSDELRSEITSVIDSLIRNGISLEIPFVYVIGDKAAILGQYITENATLTLFEGNKFELCGPMEISYCPSGTYTIENGKLTLFGAGDQVYKFLFDGDTIAFESGTWLENWIEPGTVLTLSEAGS